MATGGSGNSYEVDAYPNGLDADSIHVTARQLQIDADETIPAGTWVILAKTGDGGTAHYYMQVPVWL